MDSKKRKQTGVLVRGLFAILMDHPEGVAVGVAVERLWCAANGERTQLYEQLMRECVAPIKAGWLSGNSCSFTLSEEGRVAFENYADPKEFIGQAGRLSLKGWMSVHFPQQYFFLGKLRDRFASEYRVVKRIGIKTLMEKAIGTAAEWQEVLPVQSPRRIKIPGFDLQNLESFLNELTAAGLPYGAGGHAVYLPPQTLLGTAFRTFVKCYPPNSGLKIVKHPGGISESVYVGTREGESLFHLRMIHNLRHLTLVANLLHSNGVGPKLYDLVELECQENLWTAFVVEHVGRAVTSMSECNEGIRRIRDLEEKGVVKVILPAGFDDPEFQCPDCSGNAFTNVDGQFRYVDFQNFALIKYGDLLKNIAVEAVEVSHFGDKSLFRGGSYLYQSVPGVNLPGKRSVDDRMKVLTRLMEATGVTVQDRLVLDVGCNIGMMMAQYLHLGALWCQGWDRPSVVPHTEKLLQALGCTRFSTTGSDITKSRMIENDVEPFLRPYLHGCAISYLAVRGHIGWLESLAHLPWAFLIYEGHEGETTEQFAEYINELNEMIPIRVAAQDQYSDGDSEPRTVAILVKI